MTARRRPARAGGGVAPLIFRKAAAFWRVLLTHLYALIAVLDNQKHDFVGDELAKLLARGAGGLAGHPEKGEITRRYLKFQPSLYRQALARLVQEEQPAESEGAERPGDRAEDALERPLSLHEPRLGAVLAAVRAGGAGRVLDLGCGTGKLLRELLIHSVVVVTVERVADSCGFAVLPYGYKGERSQLLDYAHNKGAEGMKEYRARKNRASIDGVAGLRSAGEAGR